MTEESLFELALNAPESERAALLDRECQGDPELRSRVEALLAAHRSPEPWLASPHDPTGPHQIPTVGRPATCAGTVIARRYKLLQRIGEGGMGEVWMAEQTEPVRRRVAVKLIRGERGGSQQILARFEAERQAIALMDHPNVAKLLDAGSTEEGMPFFVMELVKGVPLNEFCDAHKLSVRERLELFVQICSAVQHAHQKGIIHRDLKPSNVLVENHDGKPVPRVIDFGLAKAVSGMHLTGQTLFTAFGAFLGTPMYVAPEQANFSAIDVDTRADVYALGVMLYELLTGTTPLERDTIKQAAFDEVLRLIREQEPPAPSKRLSACQGESHKLGRSVRGELDWIVMKALSKERERRYETASGFARDVERFMANEPVLAGPPSTFYRFRKFVRRNRAQVAATALLLLVLAAGVVGTTWQAIDARRKEKLAVARLRQIETINDVVFDVFAEFDVRKAREGPNPVEQVLAEKLIEAGRKLDAESIRDPLVLARLRNRLGETLLSLGRPQEAIEFFEAALEVRKDHLGPDHRDTLTSMNNLASSYQDAERLHDALPLFEKALELSKVKLGPDHPDTIIRMGNLGLCYKEAGKLDEALPLCEQTLELRKARLGPDHPDTLLSMNNLALVYQAAGRLDEALRLFEKALELSKAKPGPDHPSTITIMGNLARTYEAAGKPDRALPLLETELELTRGRQGADHPDTLASMKNLARAYQVAARMDRALPLRRQVLESSKAKFGLEHPDTLTAMTYLAICYRAVGQLDAALPLCEKSLELRKAKLPTDHPDTLSSMNNLAVVYHETGRLDEALPLYEETLARRTRSLGPDHPSTIISTWLLGRAYCEAKQGGKGVPLLKAYLAAQRKRFPEGDPQLADYLASVSWSLLRCGQFADAEPLLRECLAIREKAKPDDSSIFSATSRLGGALLGQKKYDEAEPLLLKGYEGLMRHEKSLTPAGRKNVPETLDRLIELYAARKDAERVKKYRAARAKWADLLPPPLVEK